MSDFAVVNMRLLESDLMDTFESHGGRLFCIDIKDNQSRLKLFMEKTKKYIDVDGLKKMQNEKDDLSETINQLRAENERLKDENEELKASSGRMHLAAISATRLIKQGRYAKAQLTIQAVTESGESEWHGLQVN